MSESNPKPPHSADSVPPARGPLPGTRTLKRWQLTVLLIALAVVPSAATVGLFLILPDVQEGKLPVEFTIAGVPDEGYYQAPAQQRPPLDDPRIILTNRSQTNWDVLNVVINRGYEIRDPAAIVEPGETIVYRLNMFYNRSGFTFQPELAPVTNLRVFARVGKNTRQSIELPITAEMRNQKILMDAGKAVPQTNLESAAN